MEKILEFITLTHIVGFLLLIAVIGMIKIIAHKEK